MNFKDIYNHYNIDPAFDDLIKNAENNLGNDFDKLEEVLVLIPTEGLQAEQTPVTIVTKEAKI